MPLDFSRFRVLTFDCYGTLIDWESGILKVLRQVFPQTPFDDRKLLQIYSELESDAEAGPYQPYRAVLAQVMRGFSGRLRQPLTIEQENALSVSMRDWKPFPETVESLRRLKTKYQLAVISNVDDALFAATEKHLEVPLDFLITAEQTGTYKPSANNFQVALKVMQQPPERVLHVAQSLYHDIAPTRQLGITNVWVNRRRHSGATRAVNVVPDLEVPDLAVLAQMAA